MTDAGTLTGKSYLCAVVVTLSIAMQPDYDKVKAETAFFYYSVAHDGKDVCGDKFTPTEPAWGSLK
ncbi:MAG: hypothetical protein IMW98_06380 [Firmicutes bacterium]|nr:hypothetical protein [Bacillota bacterium]